MINSAERPLILLVEDHDQFRAVVVNILEEAGYRVIATPSAESGLALARDHAPDLAITDLKMPEVSGHEFVRRLKADSLLASTPVIVVTAFSDPATTRQAMNEGADDYLVKPINAADLLRAVAAQLERKELVAELDAFAHTVAHDLRSPISLALGRLELASLRLESGDYTSLADNLDAARQSVTRLSSIVEEMLLLARMRKSTVTHEPLLMSDIVQEALQRNEELIRTTQAQVECPDTWPLATGYAPWVIHVWGNLISNAAKYGGNPPRIHLSGTENPATGAVRFAVRDFGPGLDANTAAGTFTPFAKIPQQRGKGHGLGLSIVRQIITKLNGACGVESAPSQGATFWFELPAAAPAA